MPTGHSYAAAKLVRKGFDLASAPMRADECGRAVQDALGDLVETVTAVKVAVFTFDPVGPVLLVGEKVRKYWPAATPEGSDGDGE